MPSVMRKIFVRLSLVKIVPSFTCSMTTMLFAPPNVPEYLLWIFTNSCVCGSRSPKLVTSFSWKLQ